MVTPRTLRTPAAALALCALALTAACTGTGAAGSPTSAPPGSAEPGPTTTVTQTATATASEAPSSTPTAGASSGSTGGTPTCATTGLTVAYVDDAGGAGAGHIEGTLTFTNTGSRACALRGYPGLSYVGNGNGTQIGAPATRARGAVTTVTLSAGGTAEAGVLRASPGPYGSRCTTRNVDGLRVYPPGSTTSLFAAFRTTGCANANLSLLQVEPVRS